MDKRICKECYVKTMVWLKKTYKDGTIEWQEIESGRSVLVERVGNGWEVSRGFGEWDIMRKSPLFKSKQKAIAYAKKLMKPKATSRGRTKRNGGIGWYIAFENEENPKSSMSE